MIWFRNGRSFSKRFQRSERAVANYPALTAISTMAGAAFILADPIFQGLAVSLIFGLLSSTLLTVLVIPAAYLCFRH